MVMIISRFRVAILIATIICIRIIIRFSVIIVGCRITQMTFTVKRLVKNRKLMLVRTCTDTVTVRLATMNVEITLAEGMLMLIPRNRASQIAVVSSAFLNRSKKPCVVGGEAGFEGF
jgi:hypothetical protein